MSFVKCFNRNTHFSRISHRLQIGVPNPKIQTTSVSFPVTENPDKIFITGLKEHAFVLNRHLRVYGPIICFPSHVLHWNVADIDAINPESLCLLSVLYPKPDLFILGTGDISDPYNHQSNQQPQKTLSANSIAKIRSFLDELKIAHEILPTEKAIGAFNMINDENRIPVAAMLPVQRLRPSQLQKIRPENIGRSIDWTYRKSSLEKNAEAYLEGVEKIMDSSHNNNDK